MDALVSLSIFTLKRWRSLHILTYVSIISLSQIRRTVFKSRNGRSLQLDVAIPFRSRSKTSLPPSRLRRALAALHIHRPDRFRPAYSTIYRVRVSYNLQSAKLERHRVDRFGDHPGGTSSRSSSDDRHFDNYRAGFSGDGHHHHSNHHEYHYSNHHDNYPNQYDHQHHPNLNGEPNDSFGGGGFRSGGGNGCGSGPSMPFSGRKRGFHHSGQGASADHIDRGSYAKLYVASVPRTATEEDIRPVFKEHGNIVEIVILKDKRTGQQQGSCFVKYATVEEADRAIRALHNQYTFPGEVDSVKVRYADGERERLGAPGEKLYVNYLNKQASKREIEEIFSPYGVVEDVYIIRDELKQSRGSGFVKFSRGDMAVAAMNALNGTYIMRGCDQPLVVRFADPKKPRNGEPRFNSAFGGPSSGLRSQEPVTRLAPNLDDPMGGRVLPNASYPVLQSNSVTPLQQISTGSSSEAVSQVTNQHPSAPNVMQQLLQQSPSQLSQMPSQQTQTLPESRGSSQQAVSEMQKHLDLIQLSTQNSEQQQSSQSPRTESNSQAVGATSTTTAAVVPSTMSAAPVVPARTETVPLDCDWSEHICPDGYKYYYNCVTYESRWEKPKEFTVFEQQVRKWLQLQNPPSQQLEAPYTNRNLFMCMYSQQEVQPCVQQGLQAAEEWILRVVIRFGHYSSSYKILTLEFFLDFLIRHVVLNLKIAEMLVKGFSPPHKEQSW
ncbi:hypothetical protein L1049_005176 [Liquidambar formosana]|uniref:Flowering time control protein FCA n=1 Tax=Liquidambar formosana TaxID=63359 RepID=A0AAP0WXH0_LIQFO